MRDASRGLPSSHTSSCSVFPALACAGLRCVLQEDTVCLLSPQPIPPVPPSVTTTGRLCACRLMLFSLLLPHQLAELSPDASPREESPAAVAMTVQQLHLSDEDLACDVKACGPVIIPVFSDRDPLECRAVCVVLVYSSSTLFSFLPRAAYVCRHLECKR